MSAKEISDWFGKKTRVPPDMISYERAVRIRAETGFGSHRIANAVGLPVPIVESSD